MRTAILFGAILISDATRTVGVSEGTASLCFIVFIACAVMDLWEFIKKITS
jgi:hypothetical protein